MYAEFAKVAREEGFDEIARQFEMLPGGRRTRNSYNTLAAHIEDSSTFKAEVILWHCRSCSFIHEGKEAPECPACAHPAPI